MQGDGRVQDTAAMEGPTPGLDEQAATRWLRSVDLEFDPPLRFSRIGLGRSNLTYIVEDSQGRSLVLRRPPLGALLESAHDVAREHRFLTVMSAAGQPVPRPIALCEDVGVLGAPFYVMEHVPGIVADESGAVDRALTHEARAATGPSLARTLAGLQRVEVASSGLGNLVRNGGADFAERQIHRWAKQWALTNVSDLPLIDELARRLRKGVPPQEAVTVAHGDYTLFNSIVDTRGSVRAVLDWEMATLGDPHADLAWLLMLWPECPSDVLPGPTPIPLMPGFGTREEILAAYVDATPYQPNHLPFWMALSLWKFAIAIAGVYKRWLDEPANVGGDDVSGFGAELGRIAEKAAEAADQAGL